MFDAILNWCVSVEPKWAGFVLWVTFSLSFCVGLGALCIYIIHASKFWALAVIPLFILYALYLALKSKGIL